MARATLPLRVACSLRPTPSRPSAPALSCTDIAGIPGREVMSVIQEASERPIDRYFASYSGDHQNATNQHIHVVAVPLILWSVVALIWCIPGPGTLMKTGIWAALAMFAAWMFYYRLSRTLGLGMLAVFFFCGCVCRLVESRFGLPALLWSAVAVFVLAWIAQFIGHKIEGRKPSFLTDLTYLLIGPVWVLSKLYRHLGWKY
jgi:uncharacterized membrane protein YGL010W